VDERATTFDAVLPLHPRDLERARMLASTLHRFVEGIGRIWIVTRPEAADAARGIFAPWRPRVLSDADIVPELHSLRARLRARWWGARFGHNVQQLAKLEMGRRVGTPYYLTLDADVLAVKRATVEWLFPGGRSRVVRLRSEDHRRWYETSAALLGLPRSEWQHGVTPVLLHTASVRALLDYLDGPGHSAANDVRGPGWRAALLRRRGWTEYSLYHTYVEARGAFEEIHEAVDPGEWVGPSVWDASAWEGWSAREVFLGDGEHRFSVIQSTAGVTAEAVHERIARYLGPEPSDSARSG
jgi:hypothetical protein